MTPYPDLFVADAVLGLHLLVIAFNVFGLVIIPLGGWFGWRFVRVYWWRLLHLVSLAVVALQALAGRACFLTIIQQDLVRATGSHTPLVMGFVNRLIFWPLPMWAFTVLYALICFYALALWGFVPPGPHSIRFRKAADFGTRRRRQF